MRRVLVCSVQTPFVEGGAEILARDLHVQLERRGFSVDTVSVPFKWYPIRELVPQTLVWRFLNVAESGGTPIDLVIATKYPTWVIQHPHKVAWIFHQHREVYDLYGTEYCAFQDAPRDNEIRDAVRKIDTQALGECRKLFSISQNVANRLAHHNGLSAEALYPPPRHIGLYRNDGYGDYLFFAGRLDRLKRLDLALSAMAQVRSSARLKIAGTGSIEHDLKAQIAQLGLAQRVDLLGFVSPEDLVRLYAGCRAAYYAPHDEDYGYVTVEAFFSEKPVITTTDSGGPLEFVTDGETGFVATPEPAAIAEAVDRLWALPETRLREMGAAAKQRVQGIGWDVVIDRLTEGLR
jgi:glycosyltransferase involved in cell wall biosynthesis